MARRDAPESIDESPLERVAGPTVAGRVARWVEHARVVGARVETARARHSSVDIGFELVERDSSIGGGLLAGALAYRMFVLLLPTSLLLVSGLGLYAGTVGKTPAQVTHEAGLHGLIASEVAKTASSQARGVVFLLMLPAVLYATVVLYRAVAKVHAIAWHGSARGVRLTPRALGLFAAALLVQLAAFELASWARRTDQGLGLVGLAVYVSCVAAAWFVVSLQLPHGRVRWTALVPGALLFGAGILCVNAFNTYVTTRLVEDRANTYGALGIAAALLFSLVLVGRLIVVSAELNASLAQRGLGAVPSGTSHG